MPIMSEKPWVKFLPESDTYGRFIVEPLERGYGATLGNALRRVLLSSLTGAAVTSIRVEGVLHEFSTIAGVVEDMLQIILNIKELVIRSHSDIPKIITLKAKNKGVVAAADIEHDAEIEMVNPEHKIATLEAGGKLKIEMVVERGRGFIPSEANKKPNQPLGTIPVDSIFTPVLKVNLATEEVRVGREINYDRLVLDVWTNGSITPDAAVKESAKILSKHIDMFLHLGERLESEVESAKPDEIDAGILDMSIEDLELSARAFNCLKKVNVKVVRDLLDYSLEDLMAIKHFGAKSAKEVRDKLLEYNLKLKGAELSDEALVQEGPTAQDELEAEEEGEEEE